MNQLFVISGEYRRGTCGRQFVPRHRVSGSGYSDRYIFVLPGEQVIENHGVIQEHGAPIRYGHPRGREVNAAGRRPCAG